MANKRISELTAIGTPDSADLFAIVDTSASETKKITLAQLMAAVAGVVGEVVGGSGTTWTLLFTPTSGTLKLFGAGPRLKEGDDYTVAGVTITTINPYPAGSLIADYFHA